MRDTEQSILNIFKGSPSKAFDTTELARIIFPEDYAAIDNLLGTYDKVNIHEAKRRKFQLHRKLLYYLNKLVNEDILKVNSVKEKGEKIFVLYAEEGDITLEKGYKKIVITKTNPPLNQIESYEKQKIMKRYEEDTWINRFNSILIECSKAPYFEKLQNLLRECYSNVNDVIALNEFEIELNNENVAEQEFLESIVSEALTNDRTISIIINPANADQKKLEAFIGLFANMNPRKINIIFNLTAKELQKCSAIMEYVIENFSRQKIKLNIKNMEVDSAPYFKGRAGIYNFDESEWKVYQDSFKGKVFGLSCSQSTVAISVNKFFEVYKTDIEFRKAALDAAKALLAANSIQRRRSNEYFKNINSLNKPNSHDFYRYSRNYIRFWNYDWHKDIAENSNIFDLIRSTKEIVDNFCYSEETIFKSCGIPIRFKIAFSSAFRNYDSVFMGEREYKKANVKGSEDFYKGEIKDFISIREKMFQIFDGGDRLRIFRTTEFSTSDIMHELNIIMTSFKIPFFTYDFSTMRGTVKLTNFI